MEFYDKFYTLNDKDFKKVKSLLKKLAKNWQDQKTLDAIITFGFTKDEIETYREMEYMG